MKNFYRFLLVSGIVLCTYSLSATNYYVSSSGNDANEGTSENLPWKSLAKVNSIKPKPGDQILFKRGDEWSGTITAKASGTSGSPIVYGAYGTGENPKIYGSEKISGWTRHSGNIYKATVDESDITQLFLNDERMLLARYPNAGYFNTTSVNNSTTFTSTNLNSGINYVGATWVSRTSAYTIYSKTVKGSSSQTITLESIPSYGLGAGEGFFLCDKLALLDAAGEWYYDTSTNTVYLWTPGGDTPANYTIRGSIYDYGVSIANISYVTIENLEIAHSSATGINMDNGDYITIDNCYINSPDIFGVHIPSSGSINATITNNHITKANFNGIRAFSPNAIITGNTIEETGLLQNINKTLFGTADNMGTAIYHVGTAPVIEYNRLINSGYCGINWYGANASIKYNFIDGAITILGDGGGIYTYNAEKPMGSAGSVVMYNIIVNASGNVAGYTEDYPSGYGIYMDNKTTNVTIQYNTISNSTVGVFLHENNNILVQNNTFFANLIGLTAGRQAGTSYVYDNLVYGTNRIGSFVWWTNSHERLVVRDRANPVYDRNTYIHPYQSEVFRVGSDRNATDWKSKTGQDANSTFDGTPLGEGETEILFYNDTKQTKKFNLGNSVYRDLNGKQISGTLTLEPFYSKILIKTKSVVNLNIEPPKISSFTIPSTAPSLNIPISSFSAIDNIAVTGFKLTETSTSPNSGDAGWNTVAPTSYTFTAEGTKTLYAWAKDAAGNVSASMSDQVVITLPKISDITKPTITAFLISSTATSLTIPISSFSAIDNTAVTGFKLTETPTAPNAGDAGWNTVAPTSYTFSSEGTKTLYAWVKDAAGNVSASMNDQVVINLPDVTKPVVNAFSIPETSSSLLVPVSSISANDNTAIIGFKLTETSTAPNSGDAGWNTVAPTSYTFNSEGNKTLYAWVKDAAGNVSASMSDQVVITLPDKSSTFSEYLFEESAGTTVYDSKGSNNGTIINEGLRGTGVIGNGLTFTGSGYINLGHSFGENVQNEVTLSAWVKPSAIKGDYQGIIMHGGPNTDSYALYIRPDSKIIGFKTSGTTSSWVAVNNVNDLWDGNWHHIVVTYNGSEKVIYLDNVALIKKGATGKIESGAGYNLLIGAGRDEVSPTLPYKGLIDEVRIYNYAITSSQISELYNVLTKSGSISELDTVNAAIFESATQGSIAFSDTEGLKTSEIFEESIIPNKANDLKLYPNPAKSFIKVDYSYMPETGTTIEIIDSNGRTVFKKLIESTSTRIEINQYPAGLYYIKSANKHQNITKKLIIAK